MCRQVSATPAYGNLKVHQEETKNLAQRVLGLDNENENANTYSGTSGGGNDDKKEDLTNPNSNKHYDFGSV